MSRSRRSGSRTCGPNASNPDASRLRGGVALLLVVTDEPECDARDDDGDPDDRAQDGWDGHEQESDAEENYPR